MIGGSSVLARAVVVISANTIALRDALRNSEKQIQAAGKRMNAAGRSLSTRLTLPLLGVGFAAVRSAAKFDESMRRMAALVGVPQEQLNEWRQDIKDMAVEYGTSADAAAEAMFFITSAGLKGARAMDALRASLIGTAIGLGETKSVADAATSAVNAYAASGMTATRATEILAAAVREGKLEASAMAPVMGRILGTAAALDVAFEDVAGTMAVFSRTGTDAAEASTQINAIFSALLGTSAEGVAALEGAGLSLEYLREVIKKPGGLIEVMRILNREFAGQLDVQRVIIPNVRAFRGVMNAMAQDAESVDSVIKGVANSQGFLNEALEKSKGPMHALRQAWSRIGIAMIDVGNVIVPVVIPAIEGISEAISNAGKAISEMDDGTKALVLAFALIATALGPALLVLGALTRTVAALIPLLGSLRVAMLAVSGGVLLAGLGFLAAKWLEVRMEVSRVSAAAEDATEKMQRAFAMVDPETARKRLEQYDKTIADLTNQLNGYLIMAALAAETGPIAISEVGKRPDLSPEEYTALADEVEALIERYKLFRDINADIVDAFDESKAAAEAESAALGTVVAWHEGAAAATKKLGEQLREAGEMSTVMGDEFDEAAARVDAMETAIDELIKTGALIDPATGEVRAVFGELIETWRQARAELQLTEAELAAFEDAMMLAAAAVEAATTPTQRYEELQRALQLAVDVGRISQEKMNAALAHAKKLMEEAATQTDQLKQGIVDLATDAVGGFVDSIFDASQSFSEFIRQALIDLTKLIIKVKLLKLLFPKGEFLGVKIPGLQHGGYLRSGETAIVGEAGPEVVTGGPGGMTVTPLPPGGGFLRPGEVAVVGPGGMTGQGGTAGQGGMPGPEGLPGMQGGGFLRIGETAVVGERGPEIVTAGPGGMRVIPVPKTDVAGLEIPAFEHGGFLRLPGEVAGPQGVPGQEGLDGVPGIETGGFLRRPGEVVFGPQGLPGREGMDGPEGVPSTERGGFLRRPGEVAFAGPEGMPAGEVTLLGGQEGMDGPEGVPGTIERGGFLQPELPGIKIPGFERGGFIRPGEVALVGEAGPEVVTGGPAGMSVIPVTGPASAMAASEGGEAKPELSFTFNVNAMDSRDFVKFLKDNEGAIGLAVSRAVERSAALRRRLNS